MRPYLIIVSVAVAVMMSACGRRHTIVVTNDLDFDRDGEIVELDAAAVDSAMGHRQYRILDRSGREVPCQLTYDGRLIFPATVCAGSSAVYTVAEGAPSPADTIATGSVYPRRMDDLTWENDRSAFRAYGPALQRSGERAFGYDVWTKSVPHPVVARRYDDALAGIKSLHRDYGEGMDAYSVGPTLGAGTGALIDSLGAIVYPRGYISCEILDNGPLRFTVRLVYGSDLGGDVAETRLISLDAGEYLNKTTVRFDGLAGSMTYAPGIVMHRQNPDGYSIDRRESIMAYDDLTDDSAAGNGVIFVGVVAPGADSICVADMPVPEGDAFAHLLACGSYEPGSDYTYYWGSGWSKGSMPDRRSWGRYLLDFRRRIDSPLAAVLK